MKIILSKIDAKSKALNFTVKAFSVMGFHLLSSKELFKRGKREKLHRNIRKGN
jgi:hypothetical protein